MPSTKAMINVLNKMVQNNIFSDISSTFQLFIYYSYNILYVNFKNIYLTGFFFPLFSFQYRLNELVYEMNLKRRELQLWDHIVKEISLN